MAEEFDVVTGGAGFIGSHLCEALLKRNKTVRVIDNFSSGKRENLQPLQEQYGDRLQICECDIRQDERLEPLLQSADTIYHQAAVTSVRRSVADPMECHDVNVGGTLNILLAAQHCGVRKVIFASSTAVYGESQVLPKHESMSPDPISPYGATKYSAELYCKIFSHTYELPTVALRYFNVFGPRQDPESEYAAVIPRFVSRVLTGQPPIIYGDGEQSRDFVFVQDIVRANLLAAESKMHGRAFNIASGQSVTLNQLVHILGEIVDQQLTPRYEPARIGDVRHSQGDIALVRESLGFHPGVSLREGLRHTIAWFQRSIPPDEVTAST